MLRAAAYPRVSSSGQEKDGTSLETQEAAITAYCQARGYILSPDHVYREVFTGTEFWDRPKLSDLRAVVRRREIDVVVAFTIDRLTRDPVHLGILMAEAERCGVRIEFIQDQLDDSPEGQLIRFVRGYAAKVEHEKIKERSMRGKRARAESGKLMWGDKAVYGYRWRDAKKTALDVEESEAAVVRRIFGMAVEGFSLRKIARTLTEQGVPPPKVAAGLRSTKRWHPETIRFILRNPYYTGEARVWQYAKSGSPLTAAAGSVPSLVPTESFLSIAERLKANAQKSARSSRYPDHGLLRGGYGRCGYCGRTLWLAYSRHKPGMPPDLYCCSIKHKEDCPNRGSHSIAVAALDADVWERVVDVLTHPERLEAEFERMQEQDPTANDLPVVDAQLKRVERQVANLADSLADSDDAEVRAAIKERLAMATQERAALASERATLLRRRESWVEAKNQLESMIAWCRERAKTLRDDLPMEGRRMFMHALNVSVRLWAKDHRPRYRIEFRLPLTGELFTYDHDPGLASRASSGSGHNFVVLVWDRPT